jgi:predicted CXXCH cytochrome family protein
MSRRSAQRVTRSTFGLIAFLLLLTGLWSGCGTPKERYRVLSFFFDGVPDPDAPRPAGDSGTATGRGSGSIATPRLEFGHKPFSDRQCQSCHANADGGDLIALDHELCIKCHDKVNQFSPTQHGSAQVNACAWCHEPHESRFATLLKVNTAALCTQCHDRAFLSREPKEHLDLARSCLECHTAHGGDHKLIRKTDSPATRPASASPAPQAFGKPYEEIHLRPQAGDAGSVPLMSNFFAAAQQPQDDAAPVFGRQQQRPWFQFERPTASFDFLYRFQQSKVGGFDSGKTTDHFLQETLSLASKGFVLHPNFLELNAAGTFGLSQEFFRDNQGSNNGDGHVYFYDVNALFFRERLAPLTLYANRTQNIINRDFGTSLESTIDTYGLFWDIRSKDYRTTLRAYHQEQNQKDLFGDNDFSLSQDPVEFHSEITAIPHNTLTLDYQFNSVSQGGGSGDVIDAPSTSFETHDLNATHNLEFGDKFQNTFTSAFSHTRQTGDFEYDRTRIDERLRFRHTDRFETDYAYSFNEQSFTESDQTLHQVRAGFRHRLYDSLVTTGSLSGQSLDFSESSTDEYSANLGFDYRKKVPLGTFSTGLNFGQIWQTNDARSEPVTVLDVPRVSTGALPIIIQQQRILRRSVVVTDNRNLRVYSRGTDYRLDVFPDRMEIRPILGGAIASGDVVLIDYQLGPEPANTTSTFSFGVSPRYSIEEGPLKGLAVYSRYLLQNQDISSDNARAFTEDDVNDVTIGLEYRFWNITLTMERQWHDSTVVPFDADRFGATWIQPIGEDLVLTVNTTYTILNYTDEDNTIKFLNIGANADYQIARDFSALLSVAWQNDQDDSFGDTRAFQQQLEVRWRRGQTTISLIGRNVSLDSDSQDSDFQLVQIAIRRDL